MAVITYSWEYLIDPQNEIFRSMLGGIFDYSPEEVEVTVGEKHKYHTDWIAEFLGKHTHKWEVPPLTLPYFYLEWK